MSGLSLGIGGQAGLTGSAVPGLYGNGTSAARPTRTAVPEGPTTIAQAAYGGPGGGGGRCGTHAVIVGIIAAAVLVCMWWALPR